MPSGKRRTKRSVVTATKPRQWGTLLAVLAVLTFAGGTFGYVYLQYEQGRAQRAAVAPFTPSEQNQDPSRQIDGVVETSYEAASHVSPEQRVAYEQSPPSGGPHDGIWADCTGTVYERAVRTENMVHPLEHGAMWISYDPERISGDGLRALEDRVRDRDYTMLSPYPGQDAPVSLQSWEHQLKVDGPGDPRIDQFIRALRLNQYTYPEVGATCEPRGGAFDVQQPPPFDPAPPGPDAIPVDAPDDRDPSGTGGGG